MKKIVFVVFVLLLFGCGDPLDFSNVQSAEFETVADLHASSLQGLGFRTASLDVYFPTPTSATSIHVYEESNRDLTVWWRFDVPASELEAIAAGMNGNDSCPFTPDNSESSFWIPADREILGLHSKEQMTWIGVDSTASRVYCLKYTM